MVAGRVWQSISGPNHKWWALATVAIGTFMGTLDSSIVNISLPAMLSYFHTDLATIQWVVLAYLLTVTSLLLPFGRVADLWGRKKIYALGLVVFTIGSLTAGLSFSTLTLILSRVVQAVGAAMVQSNGLAITTAVFPQQERGRALGLNGAVVAAGITSGPVIGGFLVSAFGWESIFFINIPIGIIGVALAMLILDEGRISTAVRGQAGRFDWAGSLLVIVGLTTLLFALNRGDDLGWGSAPILQLFAVALISFVAFIIIERRLVSPLLDLTLFRVRAFAAGSLAALCSFLAIAANSFLMPFFLQLVLGFSPAVAGWMMTPTSLMLAILAPLSGTLSDRFGARILSTVGLLCSSVALLLISQLTETAHYSNVLVCQLLLGIGIGIFTSPNSATMFSAVPRARYGVAGGFISMMRNSGQVIGLAIAGALLVSAIAPVVGHEGLDALRRSAAAGTAKGPLLQAFLDGMRHAYLFSSALAFVGALISLSRGAAPAQTEPAPEAAPSGMVNTSRS